MGNINEIDTAEIRRLARQIGSVANEVNNLASNDVRSMKTTVSDELRGETANALQNALSELSGDIEKVSDGLQKVRSSLDAYARRVEEIDAENAH